MILLATILLAAFKMAVPQDYAGNLTTTESLFLYPSANCNFIFTVINGHKIAINNPDWPYHYKPNQVCRWIFTCGYFCHLRCHDVALPQSDNCTADKLLVSKAGSVHLIGADVYCGRKLIDVKSVNEKITMGLLTNRKSRGGRFRCVVSAEPAASGG